jgi:heat-inducible transcriptional repressor
MAALAAAGFVCNTHTSSGRIPTDEGYRYFVRHLMRPVELNPAERRMIDHQFHQIERDHDQWVQLTATVLANLTGNAAFVTAPSVRRSHLRHLDLIATQDHSALLVALFQSGTLHPQLVALPEGASQEQLDDVARRITREMRDAAAQDVDAWTGARSALDLAARDSLASVMRRIDQQASSEVWYEGISYLLAEPEFVRTDRAQDLLRCFEQRRVLVDIADAIKEHDGVQVLVGEENPVPALRDCTVVATQYGRGKAAGVIGVVGPTRMRYDRVITTIQYLSALMTELWAEICM